MKILLVSDTHGKDQKLKEALEIEKPEFVFHMGDLDESKDVICELAGCPVAMISGNNDYDTDLSPEVFFELLGFRIFMTHGHRYGVSMGTEGLKSAGRRKGADIVLFGHIHMPVLEIEEDIILANPGSLTYPRQEKRRPSYMVLYLERGKSPEFEIKYL